MATEVDPTLNTISNDQYGFMQAFMKLAEKCFPQVPDTAEDTVKTGMFGYLTEIASHSSKSSQFHRAMMYNEFFLNTAMMPTTVYNMAESEGVELKASRPASCTIIMEMEKTKFLSLIDSNEDGWLEISRDYFLIRLDKTEFRLPFSLIFSRNANGIKGFYRSVSISNSGKTLNAETPLFATEYDFANGCSIPVKEFYDETKKATMVSFSILVFNVMYSFYENVYTDASNASISKYMIDFKDKYVGATAFERFNENDEWQPLEVVTSSLKTVSESSHNVYLKRLDADTVLFYFGRDDRTYIPANGTNLKFIVATTNGENGNFTFKGIPAISIDNVDYASEFSSWVFSSPAGGSDEDSIMTHKKDIYTNRTKAKLLGSENDLNEFFASTSVGNEKSKVLVFKKRDDLINREFNSFAMLSDDTCTYETNTIPMVKIDNVVTVGDECKAKILPYMPIKYTVEEYDETDESGRYYTHGEVVDINDPVTDVKSLLLDRNKFIYFTPYSYYIYGSNTSLYNVYAYDEHISENYSVFIKTLTSESIDTPIVNYVKANRNPALSNLIHVYAYVTESEISKNRYFLMVKDKDEYTIAFEMNKNESEGCYEIALYTEEIREDTGYNRHKMKVSSIGYVMYDTSATINDIPTWKPLDQGDWFLDISEAYIYCLEPIDDNNLIPDNKDSYEVLRGATGVLFDYRLKSISTITGGFKFFENMNDILSIDIKPVNNEEQGGHSLYLDMMPVVGGRMLFSNSVYESFMALNRSIVDSIRAAAKRLHNNTKLTLKYFNTYGRTDFWKGQILSVEGEEAAEPINLKKPNLFYEIIVDRQNGYDEDIEKSISLIVRTWTETLFDLVYNNVLITERISLSNLLKELESKITDCDSINIKAVNEIDHLKYILPIERYRELLNGESSDPYFVPSFPSVNLGVLNESRALKKENDILIQFVS